MRKITITPMDEIDRAGKSWARAADECLGYADAGGGEAVIVGGRFFVLSKAEIERIDLMRVPFARLFDHTMPDGTTRVMTVPCN